MMKNNDRYVKKTSPVRYANNGIQGSQGLEGAEGSQGVENSVKSGKNGQWYKGKFYKWDPTRNDYVYWVPTGGGKAVPQFLSEVRAADEKSAQKGNAADAYGVDQRLWNAANKALEQLTVAGYDVDIEPANSGKDYGLKLREPNNTVPRIFAPCPAESLCKLLCQIGKVKVEDEPEPEPGEKDELEVEDGESGDDLFEVDDSEGFELPSSEPRTEEEEEHEEYEEPEFEPEYEEEEEEYEPEEPAQKPSTPIKIESRGEWKAEKATPDENDIAICRRVYNNLNKGWADALRIIAKVRESGDEEKARQLLEIATNNAFDLYRRAYVCHGDGDAVKQMTTYSPDEKGVREEHELLVSRILDASVERMRSAADRWEADYNKHKNDNFGVENKPEQPTAEGEVRPDGDQNVPLPEETSNASTEAIDEQQETKPEPTVAESPVEAERPGETTQSEAGDEESQNETADGDGRAETDLDAGDDREVEVNGVRGTIKSFRAQIASYLKFADGAEKEAEDIDKNIESFKQKKQTAAVKREIEVFEDMRATKLHFADAQRRNAQRLSEQLNAAIAEQLGGDKVEAIPEEEQEAIEVAPETSTPEEAARAIGDMADETPEVNAEEAVQETAQIAEEPTEEIETPQAESENEDWGGAVADDWEETGADVPEPEGTAQEIEEPIAKENGATPTPDPGRKGGGTPREKFESRQKNSDERVKSHGEVFTPANVVTKMLDMLERESPEAFQDIKKTFLDPTCGNGQFLVQVLDRKLGIIEQAGEIGDDELETLALMALATTYGIDIMPDNVAEARARLLDIWESFVKARLARTPNLEKAKEIVDKNIIVADALKPDSITVYEWKLENGELVGYPQPLQDKEEHEVPPATETSEEAAQAIGQQADELQNVPAEQAVQETAQIAQEEPTAIAPQEETYTPTEKVDTKSASSVLNRIANELLLKMQRARSENSKKNLQRAHNKLTSVIDILNDPSRSDEHIDIMNGLIDLFIHNRVFKALNGAKLFVNNYDEFFQPIEKEERPAIDDDGDNSGAEEAARAVGEMAQEELPQEPETEPNAVQETGNIADEMPSEPNAGEQAAQEVGNSADEMEKESAEPDYNERVDIGGFDRTVGDHIARIQKLRRQAKQRTTVEEGSLRSVSDIDRQEATKMTLEADYLEKELTRALHEKGLATPDFTRPIPGYSQDTINRTMDFLDDEDREYLLALVDKGYDRYQDMYKAIADIAKADNPTDKKQLLTLAAMRLESRSTPGDKGAKIAQKIMEAAKYTPEDMQNGSCDNYIALLANEAQIDKKDLLEAIKSEPSIARPIADWVNLHNTDFLRWRSDYIVYTPEQSRELTNARSAATRAKKKAIAQIKQILNGDDASEFNWSNTAPEPSVPEAGALTPEESARAVSEQADEAPTPEAGEEASQEVGRMADSTSIPPYSEATSRALSEGWAQSHPEKDMPQMDDADEAIESTDYSNRGEDGYYQIDEDIARRAHERVGERYTDGFDTSDYRKQVDLARKIASAQKAKTDSFYHEKIDAALERYERQLANWYNYFNRKSLISYGAPRRYSIATVKAVEWKHKIDGLLEKIKSIGTGGISSDDKDAISKIRTKLEGRQRLQELMKEANAYWRKNKTWDGYTGEAPVDRDMRSKNTPFPGWKLTNNNSEIRRLKGRITELERSQNREYGDDVQFDGGYVHFDKEENRLQLKFDGKPDEETRRKLKQNGFKWSPKNTAWQRQLTGDAIYASMRLGYLPQDWRLQNNGMNQSADEPPKEVEPAKLESVIEPFNETSETPEPQKEAEETAQAVDEGLVEAAEVPPSTETPEQAAQAVGNMADGETHSPTKKVNVKAATSALGHILKDLDNALSIPINDTGRSRLEGLRNRILGGQEALNDPERSSEHIDIMNGLIDLCARDRLLNFLDSTKQFINNYDEFFQPVGDEEKPAIDVDGDNSGAEEAVQTADDLTGETPSEPNAGEVDGKGSAETKDNGSYTPNALYADSDFFSYPTGDRFHIVGARNKYQSHERRYDYPGIFNKYGDDILKRIREFDPESAPSTHVAARMLDDLSAGGREWRNGRGGLSEYDADKIRGLIYASPFAREELAGIYGIFTRLRGTRENPKLSPEEGIDVKRASNEYKTRLELLESIAYLINIGSSQEIRELNPHPFLAEIEKGFCPENYFSNVSQSLVDEINQKRKNEDHQIAEEVYQEGRQSLINRTKSAIKALQALVVDTDIENDYVDETDEGEYNVYPEGRNGFIKEIEDARSELHSVLETLEKGNTDKDVDNRDWVEWQEEELYHAIGGLKLDAYMPKDVDLNENQLTRFKKRIKRYQEGDPLDGPTRRRANKEDVTGYLNTVITAEPYSFAKREAYNKLITALGRTPESWSSDSRKAYEKADVSVLDLVKEYVPGDIEEAIEAQLPANTSISKYASVKNLLLDVIDQLGYRRYFNTQFIIDSPTVCYALSNLLNNAQREATARAFGKKSLAEQCASYTPDKIARLRDAIKEAFVTDEWALKTDNINEEAQHIQSYAQAERLVNRRNQLLEHKYDTWLEKNYNITPRETVPEDHPHYDEINHVRELVEKQKAENLAYLDRMKKGFGAHRDALERVFNGSSEPGEVDPNGRYLLGSDDLSKIKSGEYTQKDWWKDESAEFDARNDYYRNIDYDEELPAIDVDDDNLTPEQAAQAIGNMADEPVIEEPAETATEQEAETEDAAQPDNEALAPSEQNVQEADSAQITEREKVSHAIGSLLNKIHDAIKKTKSETQIAGYGDLYEKLAKLRTMLKENENADPGLAWKTAQTLLTQNMSSLSGQAATMRAMNDYLSNAESELQAKREQEQNDGGLSDEERELEEIEEKIRDLKVKKARLPISEMTRFINEEWVPTLTRRDELKKIIKENKKAKGKRAKKPQTPNTTTLTPEEAAQAVDEGLVEAAEVPPSTETPEQAAQAIGNMAGGLQTTPTKTDEEKRREREEVYAPYRAKIQEALKAPSYEERINALLKLREIVPGFKLNSDGEYISMFRITGEIQNEISKLREEAEQTGETLVTDEKQAVPTLPGNEALASSEQNVQEADISQLREEFARLSKQISASRSKNEPGYAELKQRALALLDKINEQSTGFMRGYEGSLNEPTDAEEYERVLDSSWNGKRISRATDASTEELKQAAASSPEIQQLIADYANVPLKLGTTAYEMNRLTPRQRSLRQNKADREIANAQKEITDKIKELLSKNPDEGANKAIEVEPTPLTSEESAQAIGAEADAVTDVSGDVAAQETAKIAEEPTEVTGSNNHAFYPEALRNMTPEQEANLKKIDEMRDTQPQEETTTTKDYIKKAFTERLGSSKAIEDWLAGWDEDLPKEYRRLRNTADGSVNNEQWGNFMDMFNAADESVNGMMQDEIYNIPFQLYYAGATPEQIRKAIQEAYEESTKKTKSSKQRLLQEYFKETLETAIDALEEDIDSEYVRPIDGVLTLNLSDVDPDDQVYALKQYLSNEHTRKDAIETIADRRVNPATRDYLMKFIQDENLDFDEDFVAQARRAYEKTMKGESFKEYSILANIERLKRTQDILRQNVEYLQTTPPKYAEDKENNNRQIESEQKKIGELENQISELYEQLYNEGYPRPKATDVQEEQPVSEESAADEPAANDIDGDVAEPNKEPGADTDSFADIETEEPIQKPTSETPTNEELQEAVEVAPSTESPEEAARAVSEFEQENPASETESTVEPSEEAVSNMVAATSEETPSTNNEEPVASVEPEQTPQEQSKQKKEKPKSAPKLSRYTKIADDIDAETGRYINNFFREYAEKASDNSAPPAETKQNFLEFLEMKFGAPNTGAAKFTANAMRDTGIIDENGRLTTLGQYVSKSIRGFNDVGDPLSRGLMRTEFANTPLGAYYFAGLGGTRGASKSLFISRLVSLYDLDEKKAKAIWNSLVNIAESGFGKMLGIESEKGEYLRDRFVLLTDPDVQLKASLYAMFKYAEKCGGNEFRLHTRDKADRESDYKYATIFPGEILNLDDNDLEAIFRGIGARYLLQYGGYVGTHNLDYIRVPIKDGRYHSSKTHTSEDVLRHVILGEPEQDEPEQDEPETTRDDGNEQTASIADAPDSAETPEAAARAVSEIAQEPTPQSEANVDGSERRIESEPIATPPSQPSETLEEPTVQTNVTGTTNTVETSENAARSVSEFAQETSAQDSENGTEEIGPSQFVPSVKKEDVSSLYDLDQNEKNICGDPEQLHEYVVAPLLHTGLLNKNELAMTIGVFNRIKGATEREGTLKGGAAKSCRQYKDRLLKPFARLLGVEFQEDDLAPTIIERIKENLDERRRMVSSGRELFDQLLSIKETRERQQKQRLKDAILATPGIEVLSDITIKQLVDYNYNQGNTTPDKEMTNEEIEAKTKEKGLNEEYRKRLEAGDYPSFQDVINDEVQFGGSEGKEISYASMPATKFIGFDYDVYGGRERRDRAYEGRSNVASTLLTRSERAKNAYALYKAISKSAKGRELTAYARDVFVSELVRSNQRRLQFKEEEPGVWNFTGGSLKYITDGEDSHFEIALDKAPSGQCLEVLRRGFHYRSGVWQSHTFTNEEKEYMEERYAHQLQNLGLLPFDFDFTGHCKTIEGREENAVDANLPGIDETFSRDREIESNNTYDGSYMLGAKADSIQQYNEIWDLTPTPSDEGFLDKYDICKEAIGFVGMPYFPKLTLRGSIEGSQEEGVRKAVSIIKRYYQGAKGARLRKATVIASRGGIQGMIADTRVIDELVLLNQKAIGMTEIKPGCWTFAKGKGGGLAYFYDDSTNSRRARVNFGGAGFNSETTGTLRSNGWTFDKNSKTWTSPEIKTGQDLELRIREPLQQIGLLPYFFDYTKHCDNDPDAAAIQDFGDEPTQYTRISAEDAARMISRAVDRYYGKAV